MKKITILLLCILVTVGMVACAPPQDNKDGVIKVALCVSGPVNDGGFCQAAYTGLMEAKDEFGVEVTYTENIETPDIEANFTDYASQGYDLIIGHGFQFGDPALKVSEKYPNVKFACINATVSSDNVASYSMGMQDATYLMGILAASMTKTSKIGIVAGLQGMSQIQLVEGYKAGARSIDPDIDVAVAFTGSFTDVQKAKDAAVAMIDGGADILAHGANQAGMGVIAAAEENGILCTGDSLDQNSVAPDVVMCSTVYHIPKLIAAAIKDVKDGVFKGEMRELGMKEGIVDIADYHGFTDIIPQEVKDKIAELRDSMKEGTFTAPRVQTLGD